MGARGPIPNHSDDLARPRERRGKDEVPVTKGTSRRPTWPHADPEWHKIARELYAACRKSGQADFYQQSDIALLYSLCEDLSVYKKSMKRSGQMLQTIYAALGSLLVTEGDRRRVRIELTEPGEAETDAEVIAINAYQQVLGVAK